jgi:hypothetical protein
MNKYLPEKLELERLIKSSQEANNHSLFLTFVHKPRITIIRNEELAL